MKGCTARRANERWIAWEIVKHNARNHNASRSMLAKENVRGSWLTFMRARKKERMNHIFFPVGQHSRPSSWAKISKKTNRVQRITSPRVNNVIMSHFSLWLINKFVSSQDKKSQNYVSNGIAKNMMKHFRERWTTDNETSHRRFWFENNF